MDDKTVVFPSARAIRYEQLLLESSSLFLPNYITMSEFIAKLTVVESFKIVDNDSRVLLLLQASNFKEFANLQIQRNFFTFTKNSSYIFKFFEELSAEMYDIRDLTFADTYAEYEEHIAILQELYDRYEKLCNENRILDRIFLPKIYKFNEEYAKTHKKIDIHVDGHLTNFELKLLQECCEFCSVNLIFSTTKFNKKMQNRLQEFGIEFEVDYEYKISLNTKKIVEKKELHKSSLVACESFSESLLQIAFVKHKIYEFVKKGYKAENIAVILPEESKSEILQAFDEKSNFNFAMGESYSKTALYEKLNATCKAIEQDSKENRARLTRVGNELYGKLQKIYYQKSSEVDVILFLSEIKEHFASKEEIKIYEEELYKLQHILDFMKNMSIKSIISLLLQRLSSRTLDDVRGGKITVMGVLETRAVTFDGVIIIDFNDKSVPKRSDKDMFLNSKIREKAKLPTMIDRENLQKHYYQMLINRSKEVAISYVSSDESSGSRFLKQLGIEQKTLHNELEYADTLFQPTTLLEKKDDAIKREYSFKDVKLSATRLKTFLTCKRKYFYKYVEHISNHEIPKDMPKEHEIGNVVHEALKNLYTKKSSYSSLEGLKRDLHKELDSVCGESELEKYLISMQKKRMDDFCHKEIERFHDGWQVKSCEESLYVEFAGMTLIGQLDRIDKKGDELEVLDYKTGSYPLYNAKNYTEASDFQLEFYYLLAATLSSHVRCAYYDLKESKIVPEPFLQEKLAILESHIKDLLNIEDVNFEKCEERKNCLFCEYRIMCDRG